MTGDMTPGDIYDALSWPARNLIIFSENDRPTYDREREIFADLIDRADTLDARQWQNATTQAAKNLIAFAVARWHATENRRTVFSRAEKIEAGTFWLSTLDAALAEYQRETEATR